MSHQQMNEVDEFVTPALNQGLLGQPLDLAAINGSDLGFGNIDTWLGGMAEIHQPGGLLGETFDAVFVSQIEALMDGDRF